jgi:DNA-binding response OmpR family regulator
MHILCVEDNPLFQKMVKLILDAENTHLGVKIDCLDNGEDGFNAYCVNAYDLIIIDQEMPVMNGTQSIKAIRAHEKKHQLDSIPILMMSGNDPFLGEKAALRAGANAYLSKPFTAEALINACDRVLRQSKKTRLRDRLKAL